MTGRESAKRLTQQVRESLIATFDELGGRGALLEWARENPTRFFDMWAKAVPRESEAASKPSINIIMPSIEDYERRIRSVVSTQ